MVKADPALLGEFISSPVNLDTVEAYHIDNYGSAMAPFYTILALWVGALILVALLHVQVEPEEGIDVVDQNAEEGRYYPIEGGMVETLKLSDKTKHVYMM